jgi:nucleoside 2-deoxyribosyltransferase
MSDNKKVVYLSGPITGYENNNRYAFDKAKTHLEVLGYEVISPFDLDIAEPKKGLSDGEIWKHYMTTCVDVLLTTEIDMVVVLEDWEKSKGATVEVGLAKGSDIPVIPIGNFSMMNEEDNLKQGIDKDPDSAMRDNTGKPQLSYNILCPKVLEVEARVWEYGAEKYDRGNWLKGQSVMSSTDSLMRHLVKFIAGEDDDDETGIPHVGHIITCAKILANGYLNHPDKFDDRPKDRIEKNE